MNIKGYPAKTGKARQYFEQFDDDRFSISQEAEIDRPN